jgi:hypothetical protein
MYNVSVAAAGVLTLSVAVALGVLPSPGTMPGEFMGVLLYGLLANVCYSMGPVADLVLRRILGIRAPDIPPVLFRYGFVFSVGLTLLPIPLMVAGTIAQFLFGMGPR